MELFLAQNHAPMTHLPIACSILAALAAIAAFVYKKPELTWAWAVLAIIAFLTVFPAIVTGIYAAIGRMYLEHPGLVQDIPENDPIAWHQRLGISGAILALVLAFLGIRRLRGKENNRIVVLLFSLALAIVWGIGGHLGGKTSWSADSFPGLEQHVEDNQKQ